LASTRDTHKKRYVVLLIARHQSAVVREKIPGSKDIFDFIVGRTDQLRRACASAGVFLHSKGELENEMPSYTGDPWSVIDEAKQRVFSAEREFILNPANRGGLGARYTQLNEVLDEACGKVTVDLRSHV